MSDLETVVVTFQTKLSDVMETVMKTAMYEVTRLVEDGLLLEMKRRSQEMESLRTKLLLAEKKLIGQEAKDQGRGSNRCAVAAVNLSRGRVEEEKGKVGRHLCVGRLSERVEYKLIVSSSSSSSSQLPLVSVATKKRQTVWKAGPGASRRSAKKSRRKQTI